MPGDHALPRISLRADRLIAKPRVQDIASKIPGIRWLASRDGSDIFDILQGFVASQVLSALVETGTLRRLLDGPACAGDLGQPQGIPEDRMEVLLQAGTALRLLKRRRDGRFALARRGAAILGVPGLEAVISHNRVFYGDMADPVGLLQGKGETELARFWPYVMRGGADDPETAGRYSDLMAQSQGLVAQDTLRQVRLDGVTTLMDVGGGSGAFLAAVLRKYAALSAILVDLPEVMPTASAAIERVGLSSRVTSRPASFREEALPQGADAISLVRVLYDHSDETVADLLMKCFAALPPGGRIVVSEPMSGGERPDAATDVYFALYTMAMGTGRVRSAARIGDMCRTAGFTDIRAPKPQRPYVTSVVTAIRPV